MWRRDTVRVTTLPVQQETRGTAASPTLLILRIPVYICELSTHQHQSTLINPKLSAEQRSDTLTPSPAHIASVLVSTHTLSQSRSAGRQPDFCFSILQFGTDTSTVCDSIRCRRKGSVAVTTRRPVRWVELLPLETLTDSNIRD